MASDSATAQESVSPNGAAANGSGVEEAHVHHGSGDLVATRDAPVGGQAVIEGVMMRGIHHWAVAVRTEDGEIVTEVHDFESAVKKNRFYKLPVVRGVVALVESMGIGIKALGIAANKQLGEEEEEIGGATWALTVAASLIFSVAFFFLLPLGVISLVQGDNGSDIQFVLFEKVLRIVVFIAYLWVISLLPDLRRVFEYHGAEHKTIFNYESGLPLTPENAQRFTRFHPRCGTSFLLLVFIVSIFVLLPLGRPEWYILFPSRVLAVPIVAGLAFELIKLIGKHRTKAWARAIMWPGLQLQRLTTREPDLEQLAVAIASLEAVLEKEDPREALKDDEIGMEIVA
ncbi:MAG: DUF1385 domain-containing protein [Thermoleophilaceae bacterium]|nr:DUF1385 domain-containing protein [Thermoleophilaceae bacterium]